MKKWENDQQYSMYTVYVQKLIVPKQGISPSDFLFSQYLLNWIVIII